MSKRIFGVWLTILLSAIVIVLLGASMVKNVRQRDTKVFRTDKITDWEIEYNKEKDKDGKYRIHYKNRLPDIEDGGEVLMFYVYHADVSAYADGELLYRLELKKDTAFFPVVSGDSWNCFHVPERYEGKELEIVLTTEYSSYLGYMPEFYLGDRLNIVRTELQRAAVSMLLCIVICVVGLAILIYSWLVAKNNYDNYDMMYLGIFAILMSVWFFINMPVVNMVFDMGSIFTNLSYLILGAVTVPIVLFEKRLMDKRYGRPCDILCMLSIGMQLICLLLQLTGIRDLKETLIGTHIVFAIAIIGLITMLILNLLHTGFRNVTRINRINLLFGMITAVGVAFDLVHYYLDSTSGKNYEFTKLAFLVYIIALSYFSICETIRLMKKGKDAQRYEKLAYMDELTGVFNRMACNRDMRELDVEDASYMVFMFDLNNLKKCNDTMGHEFGDLYITNCAKYIREAFSEVGRCYRIGGDEFCVIGKAVGEGVVRECYHALETMTEAYNQRHPLVDMSIACGHAVFDAAVDEDLKDTRARADKLMYKNKVEMKESHARSRNENRL